MYNVLSINGQSTVIGSVHDFENLTFQHMGEEASKWITSYVTDLQDELAREKADTNNDIRIYEMELESNMRAFQDLKDEIELMQDLLQEKHTSKKKLQEILQIVSTIINNQI
jgi:antirestriction protein